MGTHRNSAEMSACLTKAHLDIEKFLLNKICVGYQNWQEQIAQTFYNWSMQNTDLIEETIRDEINQPNDEFQSAAFITTALLKILDRNPHADLSLEQQALSDMIWYPERILAQGTVIPDATGHSFQLNHYFGTRFLVQTMNLIQVLSVLAKHLDDTLEYKKNALLPTDGEYPLLQAYSAEWLNAQCDLVAKIVENDKALVRIGESRRYSDVDRALLNQNAQGRFVSPLVVLDRPTPSAWASFMNAYHNSPKWPRIVFYRSTTLIIRANQLPHEVLFPELDLSEIYPDHPYGSFIREFFQLLSYLHIPVIWDLFTRAKRAASEIGINARLRFIAFTLLAVLSSIPIFLMGLSSLPFHPLRSLLREGINTRLFMNECIIMLLNFLENGKDMLLSCLLLSALGGAPPFLATLSLFANYPFYVTAISLILSGFTWIATPAAYFIGVGVSELYHGLRRRMNQRMQQNQPPILPERNRIAEQQAQAQRLHNRLGPRYQYIPPNPHFPAGDRRALFLALLLHNIQDMHENLPNPQHNAPIPDNEADPGHDRFRNGMYLF